MIEIHHLFMGTSDLGCSALISNYLSHSTQASSSLKTLLFIKITDKIYLTLFCFVCVSNHLVCCIESHSSHTQYTLPNDTVYALFFFLSSLVCVLANRTRTAVVSITVSLRIIRARKQSKIKINSKQQLFQLHSNLLTTNEQLILNRIIYLAKWQNTN